MLNVLPDLRISQARKYFRNILDPNTGMTSLLFFELKTFKRKKTKQSNPPNPLDATNVLFLDLGVGNRYVHVMIIH